jgi:hypothetical protein
MEERVGNTIGTVLRYRLRPTQDAGPERQWVSGRRRPRWMLRLDALGVGLATATGRVAKSAWLHSGRLERRGAGLVPMPVQS